MGRFLLPPGGCSDLQIFLAASLGVILIRFAAYSEKEGHREANHLQELPEAILSPLSTNLRVFPAR